VRKTISCVFIIALLTLVPLVTGDAIAKPRTQSVKIKITERGYEPGSFRLRKGVPARVTFLRTTDATCAKEIVLPDFNIRRALPLNQAVAVNFTPTKRGDYSFVCGMNMMRGQLIVQ
jgi:plastocyanin domain-containing protein